MDIATVVALLCYIVGGALLIGGIVSLVRWAQARRTKQEAVVPDPVWADFEPLGDVRLSGPKYGVWAGHNTAPAIHSYANSYPNNSSNSDFTTGMLMGELLAPRTETILVEPSFHGFGGGDSGGGGASSDWGSSSSSSDSSCSSSDSGSSYDSGSCDSGSSSSSDW